MPKLDTHERVKVIGLMGGMGWEASAGYYRILNQQVRAKLGGTHSARVILDSFDFEFIASAKSKEDFERVRAALIESGLRLQNAGADFVVIACNTVHRFAPAIGQALTIPLLHIADVAGAALQQDSHQRVGLLGTLGTMRGGFYKKRLAHSIGIDLVVPSNIKCKQVDTMIVNELARGSSPQDCAARIDAVAEEFAEQGCTAVLLACTEFGLAYDALDAPIIHRCLPLYDSGVLHALAAVDASLL